MDLAKLALSLGLPKESTEAAVFEAVAKRDAESRKAVESLETLTGQLPDLGLKLEAGKLVRVEPLKLDIAEGDDDEKKALKAELAKNRLAAQLAEVKGRKEVVAKLCKDMALPPAMLSLAEEVFSVREELESVCLSKDGAGIELKKTTQFPAKLERLIRGVVNLKGSKIPTAGAAASGDVEMTEAERKEAFDKFFGSHVEKKEELEAAKK